MRRIPIPLLLIVAIFCTAAAYVKSDDAKWADLASSGQDFQAIALEPIFFLDGEGHKALLLGDSFSGCKWMLRVYLGSPRLSFLVISNLKQRQPILRC